MNWRLAFLALIITFFTQLASAAGVSGTLPVIYINTENNREITSKQDYLVADCWLDPLNTGYEAVGSKDEPLLLNIRGRGNYTWIGFDKKPYKLKFDKKQSLLGMKKSKHFVLLAHADDHLGFMRNTLGFELSRRLGMPWTPSVQPVELVLNGDYRGLYFLTENIRVDEDRVNIVEQKDLATDADEITGGWLVEIDNYNEDPHVTIYDDGHRWGTDLYFTYKTPEVLSPEQERYLKNYMQRLNDMFIASNKNASLWEEYVDLEQLVRYYIVQEIMDDGESFHGSCYLYKDLGEAEKWKFGPVWDFGNAYQRGDSKKFIYQSSPFGQAWIGEIAKFNSFQAKVSEVWKEFLTDARKGLEEYLDDFVASIRQAALADARRWPNYGNSDIDSDLKTAKSLMQNRISWLNGEWGDGSIVIPTPDPTRVTIYLRGNFNNWRATDPFTLRTDGLYWVQDVSPGDKDFKVGDTDWEMVDFGSNGDMIVMNEWYQMMPLGSNIVPYRPLDHVDVLLDTDTYSILVVATGSYPDPGVEPEPEPDPDPTPQPGATIYLRGEFNGWDVTHPFTLAPDGLYYISNVSPGKKKFKIADEEWGDINLGAPSEDLLYIGTKYPLLAGSNPPNITPYHDLQNVDFIVDLSEPSLLVVMSGTLGAAAPSDEASGVRVEGNVVTAPGLIRVYDPTGRLLQQGHDRITLEAKGLLIIVTSEKAIKLNR